MKTLQIGIVASVFVLGAFGCTAASEKTASKSDPMYAVCGDTGFPTDSYLTLQDELEDYVVSLDGDSGPTDTGGSYSDSAPPDTDTVFDTGVADSAPAVDSGETVVLTDASPYPQYSYYKGEFAPPDKNHLKGDCECALSGGIILGNSHQEGKPPGSDQAINACFDVIPQRDWCTKPYDKVQPLDPKRPLPPLHNVNPDDGYTRAQIAASNAYWLVSAICNKTPICFETDPSKRRTPSVYDGELRTIQLLCPEAMPLDKGQKPGTTFNGCDISCEDAAKKVMGYKPWNPDGAELPPLK